MKLKDIFTFLALMGLFYLISSFNSLSFNPILWSTAARYFYSITGTTIAIAVTLAFKLGNKDGSQKTNK